MNLKRNSMCRRPSFIRRLSARAAVAVWPTKQHLWGSSSTSHRSSSSASGSNVFHDGTSTSSSVHVDEFYAKGERVYLPAKTLVGILALSTTIPFLIGYFGPLLVLHGLVVSKTIVHQGTIVLPPQEVVTELEASNEERLPIPSVSEGKHVPLTLYTSKMFPSAGSATSITVQIDRSSSASTFQLESKISDSDPISQSQNTSYQQQPVESSIEIGEDEESTDNSHDSDLHLPAGQHLLVDIKNVDSEFLNSEQRLATAMVELITESQLTLLSYHCHSLVPIGVSCAGVLLESHVAFHTWPLQGVIVMDLFTCGSGKLIPILPLIEKVFGVPVEGEDAENPAMLWSHKLRGFREGFVPGYDPTRNPLDSDTGRFYTGRHHQDYLRVPVLSASTDFQTVDVYDIIDPAARNVQKFHKSLEDDGSFESLHPEHFGLNRVLLLDGVLQSTLFGDAPYHESIVHPAMITHPNPKRVAIIGGGEGATLREILKHSTVEQAVMIEIDGGVVSLSKDYLPEWQDCSTIAHHEGRDDWCFNDTRADARFEDAMAYFTDNFSPNKDDDYNESTYDVIVMDCLDPNDKVEFSEFLYTSDTYIQSLHNALTDDGILVVQVGMSPQPNQAADETGEYRNRSEMMKKLNQYGFKSIHIYDESHSGFFDSWSTLLAFKDAATRERWYRSSAEIGLDLSRRILSTKEGKSSLRYFDGATMKSYQMPGKFFETVHCNQEEQPQECNDKSYVSTSAATIPSLKDMLSTSQSNLFLLIAVTEFRVTFALQRFSVSVYMCGKEKGRK